MTRESSAELVRGLGLLDSILLVIGIVIGSGIFLTTGLMAAELPSPFLIMTVWAVGGILTVAGALTFAELGAAMPEAGGQYVYLREAYGSLSAFLFGWITLLVYQPGSIAAVAVGFAAYLGYFVPEWGTDHVLVTVSSGNFVLSLTAGQVVASVIIVFLTHLNARGLRAGSLVQNVFTFLKVGAIAAFVLFGLWWTRGNALPEAQVAVVRENSLLTGFGVALIAALWAFDGWGNLNFSAGEIKDPGRTLPRALILGTAAVTVIYLLTNWAYLRALSIPEMQGVTRVAETAATALFGPGATSMIAAAVLVSTFGATNGTILTGGRVYYAMAKDGLFFDSVARVHPRYRTPHVALWVQGLWSSVLSLTGTFDQLFTYAMLGALIMYGAATASVFTLRRKRPDLPRPYRVWGYPVLPALYLAALVALMLNTLSERPLESILGLVLFLLGVPIY
ncbi:MAG: APC family permease, partial [Vicinamibacteria bacterium]